MQAYYCYDITAVCHPKIILILSNGHLRYYPLSGPVSSISEIWTCIDQKRAEGESRCQNYEGGLLSLKLVVTCSLHCVHEMNKFRVGHAYLSA
jgi:hypothetical protein